MAACSSETPPSSRDPQELAHSLELSSTGRQALSLADLRGLQLRSCEGVSARGGARQKFIALSWEVANLGKGRERMSFP